MPPGSQRIVIDPITRIEGHLRIEVQIENGRVTDAWSSGTIFRGMETGPARAAIRAMPGSSPQRICGVCTTVHAIASVRAVENALGITIPDNARIIRNLLEGIQFVQDHVIHFYHLHALDWVDVVSALVGRSGGHQRVCQVHLDWPNNSPAYFAAVQSKLQTFVNSGQLGIFANGYWGHPAYKLPPEGNLLAVAHYLEALDWQREVIKIQAILGGKNPHPQTYLVGGMAIPVDPTSPAAINPTGSPSSRRWPPRRWTSSTGCTTPTCSWSPRFYPEWAGYGRQHGQLPLLSATSRPTTAAARLRSTCRAAIVRGTTTWPRRRSRWIRT